MKYVIECRVRPGTFEELFKSWEKWRKHKEYGTLARMMQAMADLEKRQDKCFEYRVKSDLHIDI